MLTSEQFQTIYICCDIWLCKPKRSSFITFNGHFFSHVTNQIVSITLKFKELQTPQNSRHIAEILEQVIREFKLEQKQLIFNSDEGANIVKALSSRKRISCVGHILHNLVTDWFSIDRTFRKLNQITKAIIHFFKNNFYLAEQYYSAGESTILEDEINLICLEEQLELELDEQQSDQQQSDQKPHQKPEYPFKITLSD